MPPMESQIFRKKGVRRYLTLVLDEGDGMLESIKASMLEHAVYDVKIEAVEGNVQEAVINYFERNQFRSSTLKGNEIMIASGNFKLSYGELFGTFKLATGDKPPMQGTLVKGKAANGLTISLSFIEYISADAAEAEAAEAKASEKPVEQLIAVAVPNYTN
ncbi:Uncharacterised protein [uncultured archaeon]|nr:Uncharacterised protein [uncultured archaeon]